jgi:hypothetical protein
VVPISPAQAVRAATSFTALLLALDMMGMYKGRIGSGPWHDISCPWIHLHTDQANSGSAIADPSAENRFAGGFQCHHGHCEHRTMRDVWAWIRDLSGILRERSV